MKERQGQSVFEYFLLLGIIVALVAIVAGPAKEHIKQKAMEYRNAVGNKIVGRQH